MKKSFLILAIFISMISFFSCGKKKVVVNSVTDLAGLTIGVQAGTTGEIFVKDEVKDAKIKSFKNGIDASLALSNGVIDAIVLDELPAQEIVKRNEKLMIVNDKFAEEQYAIAIKKGNKALLDSVNSTIKKIKANGTYVNLMNAFMPLDGNISIPTITEKGGDSVIKMGTNAAFPPFEYMEGSEIVGFDVAMAKYIANDCGKKLQIVDMAFDGLIAALQSDAIDFIAAGMTATDERRQNVDFSEPYYTSNQVIIIRK